MTRQRSLAVFIVMLLLISLATPVYAAPSVSVGYTRPEPGQEVTFSVSGAPTGNSAWVGIFPYEPNASWWGTNWDAADISYHYFRNLNGSGTFNLPYKEGDYIIGVFTADDSNDIPVAKSAVIQVRFAESSVSLSSSSLEPGETLTFTYTNPPRSDSAWIGLFPYEPDASWWNTNWDEADISYHYLRNIDGMSDTFTLPYEEGQYIIGLFVEDSGADMPHASSQVINVGFTQASISVSSVSVGLGESVTFSYSNPPSGNSAWIGLFPYEPNASWWNTNWDEADISYHYLRNITGQSDSFTMPSEAGSYILGLFTEDASQDMPLAMSDVISVGGGAVTTSDSGNDYDPGDVTMVDDAVTGGEQIILEVTNISGVSNTPTAPTTFTIDTPYIITYLHTYHYYNNNTPAGTIGLKSSNGTMYGPWQSEGTAGQGGGQNADWHVYTYQEIPAGTYTVVDSNPSTWSHNSGSGGRGFATVKGIPLGNVVEGTLMGTVVEIDEGTLVSGVEVNIYYNGYLAGTTYTDSNGEYSLNAYEGNYLVEFIYGGYSTTLYENVPVYSGDVIHLDHILNYPY